MSILDLFFANDGVHGVQLYATDGSTAAALTSFPSTNPDPSTPTVIDGIAYFLEADGNGSFGPQSQLWRSDGTAAGTFAIGLAESAPVQIGDKLIYLGADATHREALFASVNGGAPQFVSQLGQTNGVGFSAPFLGTAGGELLLEVQSTVWVSDGTSGGTHPLSDGESSPSIQNAAAPVTFNGAGYFVGQDSSNANQLFRLNGGGVASVVPASTIGSSPSMLALLPGHLVYVANGGELDSWDGVASTHVTLFPQVQNNTFVGDEGGKLYFLGADQANPNSPTGLYVTDGTAAGTHQVASGGYMDVIDLGSRLVLEGGGNNGVFVSDGTVPGTTEVVSSLGISGLTKVGDRAFFTVGSDQLWVTDGAVAGTREVVSGVSIHQISMSALGAELVFTGAADGSNFEPWVSDGTAAGTHAVANIHAPNPGNLGVADVTTSANGVAFLATPPNHAAQIWVSNGTVAGTGAVLTNFNADPRPPAAVGNDLFFMADNRLMVVSTAAPPGTAATQVADFGSLASAIFDFNGKLFLVGNSGNPGLYVSNGDAANAGLTQISNAAVLTQPVGVGSQLLFIGSDSADGTGLFKSDGTGAGTSFVAAVPDSLSGFGLAVSGTKVFFADGTPATGEELWVTDGTAAGTHLVKDIAPGAAPSSPLQLTPFNGGVIFDTSNDNGQVWFSNGAAAGTFQLGINQTHDPSASLQSSTETQFAGKTYFIGNDGLHGDSLYATDGTTAGTSVVALLDPNTPGEAGGQFTVVGSKLFFFDSGNVWVTDGTSAGTVELAPPNGFEFVDNTPLAVNGEVYFVGTIQNQAAADLFVTDGTNAGTHDLATLAQLSIPTAAGNDLFFRSSDPTDGAGLFAYDTTTQTKTFLHAIPHQDAYVVKVAGQIEVGTPAVGATGNNLWVTDGTAAGTTELTNLPSNVALTNFTALGGEVYFSSFGGNGGFWVTDGTAAGTQEIQSNLSIDSGTGAFEVIGGDLFFQGMDAGVVRVWRYVPSTHTLTELPIQGVNSPPTEVTPVGTGAFFVAADATSPLQLWHTDNTGTAVELTGPAGFQVQGLGLVASIGSSVFATGVDNVHGSGLYIADGSTVTFLAAANDMANFSVVGTELYFQASDVTNGMELWVSDGTPAGTHRVTDTEAPGASTGSGFTAVGSQMFFAANDGVHGQELWTFGGQPGGATMVTDLDPGAAGANPTNLTAFNGALYFAASNGSGPTELWRSDGTGAGTVAVSTAADGANPQDLTVVGAELFYFGGDSAHGAGLFVTNGAGAPTFVKAFTSIADVSVEGGRLFFQGTDASGSELWVSDGTAAGTVKLSTTGTNPGSNPTGLTSLSADFTPRQDFDGDSRSDFLIQNGAGVVVVGEAVHGQAGLAAVAGLGPEWSFRGDADFLGNGRQDFLIENTGGVIATGEVAGGQTTYAPIGGLGQEWSFHGVGHFLGALKADFLIENTAGVVAVGEVANGHATYTPVIALGPEWVFHGTGDFLGDGRDDFLIENSAGVVAIGEVVGGTAQLTPIIGLGPEWRFVGTGDFLGDGRSDFLIENAAGAVVAGEVVGGQVSLTLLTALGPEWSFRGAGDYLGEGHDQFLIENSAGALVVADWSGGQTHLSLIGALGSEWIFH